MVADVYTKEELSLFWDEELNGVNFVKEIEEKLEKFVNDFY